MLAIGIDAAEPSLVRRLIDRRELPFLGALLAQGRYGRVLSAAHIGSGAVWPTFLTGSSPFLHGICSIWPWRPETMGVSRVTCNALVPFWKAVAMRGHAVGVLDVPFAPPVGLRTGIEITNWGAHDWLEGRTEVSPPALRVLVRDGSGLHPFASGAVDAAGPHDCEGLARVRSLCLAGVRQRGALAARMLAEVPLDLLLVVFTEVHRASHLLWHTIDPTHLAHLREGAGASPAVTGGLLDIYREVDQQVGRLLEAVGSDTTVLVFSLHGMRAHEGIPTILDPLLRSLGLASVKRWEALSWPARARQVFRAVKQRIPPSLKRLYYRLVSRSLMVRIAQPTLMPAYDWSRTIAFPLPTDQHGWIRLNLVGREAQGILDPGEYQAVCSNLEGVLRGLRATDGSRVVRDVLRIARETGGSPPQHLPDLIIHWDDAASASPLRLRTPIISARPIGTKFTGQHAPEGFFILRPGPGARGVINPGGSIAAEDLHQILLGTLEGG